jgi:transposase
MSTMADTRSRRPRRQFTDEFKQQAVRLVLDEGRSVTVVARELDLTRTALHNWVEQARADRSGGKTGLTTAERDELARLRKENRILQEERDILKNVWSAPPLQGVTRAMAETACVNVSGLQVEPQLLALMESARTDPHKAFGHDRPHF